MPLGREETLRMKKKLPSILVTLLVLGLIGYAVYAIGLDTIMDQRKLTAYIEQFGAFAPLAFFAVQFLQIIVAPIPGNITGLVGGAIFGLWWGFLLGGAAILSGSLMMFWLGRKYGKRITHKFVSKEELEKYETKLSGKAGKGLLMGLFLVPFTPDDVLCLIAGLTNISYKSFLLLVLVGRLPSSFITNAMGAGLYNGSTLYVALFSLVYYTLAFLIYAKYDKIIAYKNNRKSK